MARQVIVEIVGDNSKYTKALDGATKSTGGFGSKFNATKGLVLAGAGLITGAVIGIGKEVFELGASYEAMDAKAQTVFGDSLTTVKTWADANAKAMGLTSRQAINLATNMGDLLIPMGFTREEAAAMATDTTNLAGALSEWSNGTKSASEVSDILTKAMLGERDGLKALGISITENDVKQQLMKDGTDKLTGAALEQAKAIATQTLIMEKSQDAQTAYANGGNKGARSQAEFNASIETVKETLVTALYPILKTVAKWLADNLPGAIAAAQRGFEVIRPVLNNIIDVIKTVIDVMSKVANVVVPIVIKAIKFLADVFTAVWKVISGFIDNFVRGVQRAQQIMQAVGTAIGKVWDGITSAVRGAINAVIRAINGIIRGINDFQIHIHLDTPMGNIGFDWNGLNLGYLPYLHSGGIVPGPAGADVLAVLQAGERVIPRSQANAGGTVININIDGSVYGDLDQLAKDLAFRLRLVS